MATLWERAAHSVDLILCLFVILVVSHFDFEGRTFVLIAPDPSHCLLFTFIEEISVMFS